RGDRYLDSPVLRGTEGAKQLGEGMESPAGRRRCQYSMSSYSRRCSAANITSIAVCCIGSRVCSSGNPFVLKCTLTLNSHGSATRAAQQSYCAHAQLRIGGLDRRQQIMCGE